MVLTIFALFSLLSTNSIFFVIPFVNTLKTGIALLELLRIEGHLRFKKSFFVFLFAADHVSAT